MNCHHNSGYPPRKPAPVGMGAGPFLEMERYPVGMGYVPVQQWETPFPLDRAFCRGTIFPSLDYPFVMGRCRG